jgi:hypothetical protein
MAQYINGAEDYSNFVSPDGGYYTQNYLPPGYDPALGGGAYGAGYVTSTGGFIPNYNGPELYGAPNAGRPYYYYGQTPGQYYFDRQYGQAHPEIGYPQPTNEQLNSWARQSGMGDFGRLAYEQSFFPQTAMQSTPWWTSPQDVAAGEAHRLAGYGYLSGLMHEGRWDEANAIDAARWEAGATPEMRAQQAAEVAKNTAMKAASPRQNSQFFSPDMNFLYDQHSMLDAQRIGDQLNYYGNFQNGMMNPAEFVDPKFGSGANEQVQSLLNQYYNAMGTPEAQAHRRAYANMTGGGNFGGIVRNLPPNILGQTNSTPQNPGNVWGTLNSMGMGVQQPAWGSSAAQGGVGSPWSNAPWNKNG